MDELLYLKNGILELAVAPEVGGSIFSFRYSKDGVMMDIMRPTTERALAEKDTGSFASFNLFPYSNRIEDALLKYKGREYQLDVNFPDGNAIHGEAWLRSWKVLSVEENRMVLEFDSEDFSDISWPWPFKAVLEYRLEGRSLIVRTSLKNIGSEKMPAGMGIHPYFMRNISGEVEKVNLKMETRGVYPGEAQIPTGHWVTAPEKWDFTGKRELSRDFLDHCFRAGESPIEISWENSNLSLVIERDDIFKHVVVYCPTGEEFFALEPVTNCNNGFNMAEEGIEDTGIIELGPGEEVSGQIRLSFK